METSSIPPYARDHTLLGICEALGEDLGINPLLLRLPLAVCLLFNPVAVIAVYAGLGLIVAVSRLLAPNPRPAAAGKADCAPAPAFDNDEGDMAIAA